MDQKNPLPDPGRSHRQPLHQVYATMKSEIILILRRSDETLKGRRGVSPRIKIKPPISLSFLFAGQDAQPTINKIVQLTQIIK